MYHNDTSLVVEGDDGKVWGNYAPGGCVHGVSTGQPTPQQIEQFKGIVAAVKEIALKIAQ